jgi:hypothetical protein
MFGKSPGELHDIGLPHGIDDRDSLLISEIMIKLTDAVEVTVDGLRPEPSAEQVIDVLGDLAVRDRFDRHIQPEHKVPQAV